MQPAVLDINDSNLRLWATDADIQSPGYALYDNQNFLFGHSARAAARRHPRQLNTRFWWQLSTEPLQPALGQARHTADLVHQHLLTLHREAGEPGELLLAVPTSMQNEQLSLLLGIIQHCPFKAIGLVNRSVALASSCAHKRMFHLELQLHQAFVTELGISDGDIVLRQVTPLPGCGLMQLQEQLVRVIADAFIQQTRFDPRRKAESEQLLYDALPATLAELQHSAETNIEVNGYRARVNGEQLAIAGQHLLAAGRQILSSAAPGDQFLIDPQAALLPAFLGQLNNVIVPGDDALYLAIEEQGDRLIQRGSELHVVTALPCSTAGFSPPAADSTPAPSRRQATHLLIGDRAIPLQPTGTLVADGWALFTEQSGWQLRGEGRPPKVNERDYQRGEFLGCGDRIITSSGAVAVLIEVAGAGA